MKYLDFYKKKGLKENDVFPYLVSTLRPSIAGWDYFVDWKKVQREATKFADELNLLNGLIGSDNLEKDFLEKVSKYPSIVKAFPILLAVREHSLDISEIESTTILSRTFSFDGNTDALTPEDQWEFFSKSGLAGLVRDRRVRNLTDYVFGVEAGLDSNGRKNRGGHAMEKLVEAFIKSFCEEHSFKYLKEANAVKIHDEFGYDVPVDRSSRRYDFVINTGKKLILVETNFYGKGGSKLKSTAGEYRNLFDVLEGKFPFVWITDGAGWRKTQHPLEETFRHNEYLFNLSMLSDGVLNHVQ